MHMREHHVAMLDRICDKEVRTVFERRMSQVVTTKLQKGGQQGARSGRDQSDLLVSFVYFLYIKVLELLSLTSQNT
jgi:hypothetical protein